MKVAHHFSGGLGFLERTHPVSARDYRALLATAKSTGSQIRSFYRPAGAVGLRCVSHSCVALLRPPVFLIVCSSPKAGPIHRCFEDPIGIVKSRLNQGAIIGSMNFAMNSLGCGILRNRALTAGFNGYLDKPFTPKKMLESIQSALHFSW
jgi:CheY-like chemotaxis protein